MIIKCDKCILREWKRSDLENLVKNANNIDIASNMRDGFPFPYTHDHGRQWIEIAETNDCFFAITAKGEAVGGIGLTLGEDIERISAEVGYWLGKAHWGRGIISSALEGVVDYGFNELKLERIFAVPFEHNTASRRVLEKNGFNLEGILRNSVIKSDKIYNQALYARIK
ncbi:GNAT family N-acetyltransferase [Methanobacterium aggregans]|uniref:GNAT family N-acetyltransferase n=1 Tax=Methanobacterium aggregans TaxID=1615586 RepID=UPI001AE4C132|nr:GNAT family N-acetyltransferase [Methanobacterium aggregans]MBP2045205.1 RimJ/RimL family protein N-acetyltransferase [Methanobacterium aggregans]